MIHSEDEKTENLQDEEAVEKIRKLVKAAQVCMFTTSLQTVPFNTRPMSPAETDDEGCIWFFSGISSDKNKEIELYSGVQLTFSNIGSNEFLSIYGDAEIIVDRDRFERFWSPIVKVWFKEGKDDPELSLIKVTPKQSYYWDTQHNKMVYLFKMLASIVTGKTMDDSVEGELKV